MQKDSKHILLLVISLCFSIVLSAQELSNQKTKIYETWIRTNNYLTPEIKGVLYEIKDSSILVLNTLSIPDYLAGKIDLTTIRYDQIELIKTRRRRNIGRGTLIGSLIGYASGAAYAYTYAEGMGIYTGIISFYVGFPTALVGAGTGALFGRIKDKIPVENNFENFNLYRSLLQDYSYVKEQSLSSITFEHKAFMGIEGGPSFPMGDFVNTLTGNTYIAKAGYGGSVFLGYRLSRKIGLSIIDFSYEYPIGKNGLTTSYWTMGGIMVGPMFSKQLSKNTYIDLKPNIGYANVYLVVDDIEQINGNGLGLNLNASIMYNFSNQWGFLLQAGYFYTDQLFDDKSKGTYQAMNTSIGVVYRFSKKSL